MHSIQTVIDNLNNTIAGKELLLITYENPDVRAYPKAVRETMAAMVRVNLAELIRIRDDLMRVQKNA